MILNDNFSLSVLLAPVDCSSCLCWWTPSLLSRTLSIQCTILRGFCCSRSDASCRLIALALEDLVVPFVFSVHSLPFCVRFLGDSP